ncbi:Atu4866 domain-containing protein [Myceligenerans xiligouense]|uniref:Putative ligand-binding protein with streptavidin-like fold n=1 Tax=Myceligenerans xiligouense TaxID=253184 RepID=A0A3N4ZPA1_9MICO|nr:Atu4866 domain-containing protein [Myceligenerans xiligouense]RPF21671.1 putative ligand-binding protein with streptavidin-like fold [Myceligenerans xiligouense]
MSGVTRGSGPATGSGRATSGSRAAPGGDLVVTDAVVHVTPSRTVRGDLWVSDGRITHVGPSAGGPRPADAEPVPVGGASVVPLFVDSAVRALPDGRRDTFDLAPGNPATFAVVGGPVGEGRIRRMLVVQPRDLLAVVVSGCVEVWRGEPARPSAGVSEADGVRWHGAWHDADRDMTQYLLPGGRYTETRSGRPDAWTGSYWVRDDRITYLDDTGFWAFGQLVDGVLHHAGFVLRRPPL